MMGAIETTDRMENEISKTILINAQPSEVWHALTNPEVMAKWMGEPEMDLKVHTDWKVDSPILITGFHHVKFENRGVVLACDKERRLSYSHLSSVSRLLDKPKNHSILEFVLTPMDKQTQLTLSIKNFPTESIFKHLAFYWKATVVTIKETVENRKTEGNSFRVKG
jgi:uncharacterized protein YndB with AHSA1/START domain